MIYLISGLLIFAMGLFYLIHPAKSPTRVYSYRSELATATRSGFYLAQRWCRNAFLFVGAIELLLGFIVTYFHLTYFEGAWTLTVYLAIAVIFLHTEVKLRHYLMRIGQLPAAYQK